MATRNGDYFTRRAGYVLEDKSFLNETDARSFCIEKWGMTAREATGYLLRLKRDFITRIKANNI